MHGMASDRQQTLIGYLHLLSVFTALNIIELSEQASAAVGKKATLRVLPVRPSVCLSRMGL